ncbi:MAG: hypothetical protein RL357_451 [Pseudomonadota bacterium]|jgi:DNA polymerase-4
MAHIRRVAHLDMDAFFASVELLRFPQLKDVPVIIGGWRAENAFADLSDAECAKLPLSAFGRIKDYEGRGVITTANYAARQFGVGSAMPMMKAAKVCPQAILLNTERARINEYSKRFKSIITEVAPVMENRGIDEVYIDFTDVPGGQREGGRVLARLIQREIHLATGLTCSVGVAPNKLMAKLASEMHKPNGITVLFESDVPDKMWPLPCRKLNGVGPKADERLKALGLNTLGDVAASDVLELQAQLGRKFGQWLFDAAHGRDDRPVVVESEPVSMSRETTFERDLHVKRDRAQLSQVFDRLCEQVASDLQRKGYIAKTVGVKVRDNRFQTATRDTTTEGCVEQAKDIRQAANAALRRIPIDRPIRLLGVKVSGLLSKAEWQAQEGQIPEQESLFDWEDR